jgi:multisubunit Na+/H+ antiporter MnhB subunit
MNRLREHTWLIVAALIVVFLSALSMHMERMAGWGFLVLCFVVGSLGAVALVFVRSQTLRFWSQLPKAGRRFAVAVAIPLILIVTFVANRHKPDEFANDAFACFAVLIVLLFLGFCRLVDALRTRFSRR